MLELSDRDVLSALLDAQQLHKAVKLYLQGGQAPLCSTVLGFNYYEQTLLLDSLSPALNKRQQHTLAQVPLWLQLRCGERFLNLLCLLEDIQFDLHTLKILRWEWSDNQRWFSRVHFDDRQGPKCRFDMPQALPIYGYLRNLSLHGAAIDFYGEDIRETLKGVRHSSCQIRFNELFQLQLRCDIKQIHFERKAPCHSRMRVLFDDLNPVHTNQIENFIEALQGEELPPTRWRQLHFAQPRLA